MEVDTTIKTVFPAVLNKVLEEVTSSIIKNNKDELEIDLRSSEVNYEIYSRGADKDYKIIDGGRICIGFLQSFG
jgi:hypothetical protein